MFTLEKINIKIFLFIGMLFFLSFDYRRASNDSSFILIFLVLLSLFCGFFLVLKLSNKLNPKVIPLFTASFAFLLMAIFSGLMKDQNLNMVISASFPLIFFILGLLTVSSFITYKSDIQKVMKIILLMLFLSAIYKLFFGFIYFDLNFENVRYQIISGGIPLLFFYGVTSFIIKKQKWHLFAIFLALVIIFISVTRTYILVFIISIISLILILPIKQLIKKLKIFNKIIIFLVLSILLLKLFIPDTYDRWTSRLFDTRANKSHQDVTFITRIAESEYQINELLKNNLNLITGLGIAAETGTSVKNAILIHNIIGSNYKQIGQGYGHNVYIGILFVGGIIIGPIFIFFIFFTIIKNILYLRRILKNSNEYEDIHFVYLWGILSSISYIIYGFFGGTFGDRIMSLYFGISVGLVLLSNYYLINKKKYEQEDI